MIVSRPVSYGTKSAATSTIRFTLLCLTLTLSRHTVSTVPALGETGAIWRKCKLAKSKYLKKSTRYRSLVDSTVLSIVKNSYSKNLKQFLKILVKIFIKSSFRVV